MSDESSSRSFAEALVLLYKYGRSGVLKVEAEDVRTRVFFVDGVPVFAAEGHPADAIGRLLLEHGLLTDVQYEQVLQRIIDSECGQLGQVACELGFLNEAQLDDALREQVRRKVLHCMQWQVSRRQFEEDSAVLDTVPHYPISVEALICEGARRYFGPDATAAVCDPHRQSHPLLRASAQDLAEALEMKPTERKLLDLLDGALTLDAALGRSPLDRLHSEQIVTALTLLEGVEWRSEPTHALEAAVVEVPKGALAAATAVSGKPPAKPSSEVASVHRSARRLRARLPRNPLPPTVRRPSLPPPPAQPSVEPRPNKDRLLAELTFRRGKNSLRAGLMGRALGDLRRATELDPDAIEYALYATWAEYSTTRDRLRQDALRETLADLVPKALSQDRRLAFAHFVQGQLYLAKKQDDLARKAFRIAYELDPSDKDAERHLRLLVTRQG